MVIKDGTGLLRGIELDLSVADVRKIEKDSLNEETTTFLGYLVPGKEKGEKMEVEYSFNEQGKLDLMSVFYYLDKDDDAEHMVAALKKYFEKKLGPSKKDELGWYTWQFRDKKGLPGDVEIVLNKKVEAKSKVVDLEIVKYYDSEAGSSRSLKKP